MSVYKRGRIWYYNFTVKGCRYKKALPEARTKSDAVRAEVGARQAVFDGRLADKVEQTSFSTFVQNTFLPWSKAHKRSWRDDIYISKTLQAFFGERRFDEIPMMLVEKFKKERRESATRGGKVRQPATVNRELCVLSKIFSLAIDYGVATTNPCLRVRKLRTENRIIRYLEQNEEERLEKALDKRPRLRAIVIIAISTGMRLGEILSLAWEQVDFSRRVIHLTNTKGGRERFVPLTEPARVELEARRFEANASSVFVFPSAKIDGAQGSIKRAWSKTLSEAGIRSFRFHDLRHTAATRLADVGEDAFIIASILGHSTIQMSARYAHGTDQAKRRALEKIAQIGALCSKSVPNEKRQTLKSAVSR
jgi:integrase